MDFHGLDLNLLVALDALLSERNVTNAGYARSQVSCTTSSASAPDAPSTRVTNARRCGVCRRNSSRNAASAPLTAAAIRAESLTTADWSVRLISGLAMRSIWRSMAGIGPLI